MPIDFEKEVVTASEKELIIVDFYADWCGPCKMLGPILEKLSKENNVKLIKINVDQEQELAQALDVMSIPTVVFFKNKEPKDFFVGAYPEPKIKEFIEKYK